MGGIKIRDLQLQLIDAACTQCGEGTGSSIWNRVTPPGCDGALGRTLNKHKSEQQREPAGEYLLRV